MPAAAPYPDPPLGVFDAAPYRAYHPGPPRRLERDPAPAAPRRILIVGLTAVGDVLHFLPVAVALRKAFPAARIGWVVQDKARGVVEGRAGLDRVHVLERARWGAGWRSPSRCVSTAREILAFRRELAGEHYDLLVDPQGTVKSALVNLLSGAPRRVGFARGFCREFNHLSTTDHVALPTRRMHRVRKSLALLEALGIPAGDHAARWEVPPAAQADADAELERRGLRGARLLAVHPGTSAFGARKRWPPARFAEAAARAHATLGLVPLFLLGPLENALRGPLLDGLRGAPGAAVEPRSLAHLGGFLARAACFLGCDSAPLHLASNLRVPVVGLYGPTDPVLFAPYYPPAVVVVRGLPCPACGAPHCNHPVPRMDAITVEDALDGLTRLAGLTPGSG